MPSRKLQHDIRSRRVFGTKDLPSPVSSSMRIETVYTPRRLAWLRSRPGRQSFGPLRSDTPALNCSAALIGCSAALRIAVISTLALSIWGEEREGGKKGLGFYIPNRALPLRKRAHKRSEANGRVCRNCY